MAFPASLCYHLLGTWQKDATRQQDGSEVSIFYCVQGVPKFMLFRNMQLLEEFSTREQDHLIEAVRRHADIEHLLE